MAAISILSRMASVVMFTTSSPVRLALRQVSLGSSDDARRAPMVIARSGGSPVTGMK